MIDSSLDEDETEDDEASEAPAAHLNGRGRRRRNVSPDPPAYRAATQAQPGNYRPSGKRAIGDEGRAANFLRINSRSTSGLYPDQ